MDNSGNSGDASGQSGSAKELRDADFSKLEGGSEQGSAPGNEEEALPKLSGSEREIAALKQEVEENKDKYLRALAELENSRKRAIKERSELLKYQGENAFRDLLEVVDDLERALEHAVNEDPLKAGVEMVYKKFLNVIGKWEVRPENCLGKEFDPTRHEALTKAPVDDAKPGTILKELRRGYWYRDRLLRPAQVVVAAARSSESSASDNANTSNDIPEK